VLTKRPAIQNELLSFGVYTWGELCNITRTGG
jgi:hypothetical protein